MARRNEVTDLEVIWEKPGDMQDPAIEAMLNLTNRFVDGNLLGKLCEDDGVAMTEAQLKDVELYVAAYFLNVRKPPPVSGNILSTGMSRQGGFGFVGMAGNMYGQIALSLDCSGTLRALAAKENSAATGQGEDAVTSSFSLGSDADENLLVPPLTST